MKSLGPVLATLLLIVATACSGPPATRDLEALWQDGRTFAAFLEATSAREEAWHGNYRRARVPDDLLARGRELPPGLRILAVAEDWCGDSANTLPYVAALAEALEVVDLRIVDSDAGRAVMEDHPTPDGRAATPTLVVLGPSGAEAGCWVERPSELQDWWLENPDDLGRARQLEEKYAWYDADAGRTTMAEIIEVLEGAAAGDPVCRIGEAE